MQNRTDNKAIDWRTPFECLIVSITDISMITRFKFWDYVYGKHDKSRGRKEFPSSSNEIACSFVSFSEYVGHPITYKVPTFETNKIIYRYHMRLATIEPNFCIAEESQESY